MKPDHQDVAKKYQLIRANNRLELHLQGADAPGPIFVDFLSGVLAHRRQYGGGRNQLIAKAVGVKPKQKLTVLDVTAGLGRDAFVLALLGCDVIMCERSPVVFELLADGLKRAREKQWFCDLKLSLQEMDASAYLQKLSQETRPDVIYMDPMFPDRSKSALVKKEMRALKTVVGEDLDAADLFAKAVTVAKKRVVVKRSKLAPTITALKPTIVIKGKSSRFDVYLT